MRKSRYNKKRIDRLKNKGKSENILEIQTSGDFLVDALTEIETMYAENNEIYGIETGYQSIDNFTAGIENGTLLSICSKVSELNKCFGLNLLSNFSVKKNVETGYISLESSTKNNTKRLLSINSNIKFNNISRGLLKNSDFHKITEAAANIYDAPMYQLAVPTITIDRCIKQIEIMANSHNIKVVFIDDLISDITDNMDELNNITRILKKTAQRLNIIIFHLVDIYNKDYIDALTSSDFVFLLDSEKLIYEYKDKDGNDNKLSDDNEIVKVKTIDNIMLSSSRFELWFNPYTKCISED